MIKKFWNWLNKPRYIEFGTLEDDEPIIKGLEEPTEHELENVHLTLELNARLVELKSRNFDETMFLIRKSIKNDYEKDGLLVSEKQLKKESEKRYIAYCNCNLIDNWNNLKPAVKEVLQDIK